MIRYTIAIRGQSLHIDPKQVQTYIHSLPDHTHLLLPNGALFNHLVRQTVTQRSGISLHPLHLTVDNWPAKLAFLAQHADQLTLFLPEDPAAPGVIPPLDPFDTALATLLHNQSKPIDIHLSHRPHTATPNSLATRIAADKQATDRQIAVDLMRYPTPPEIWAILGPARGIQHLDHLLDRLVQRLSPTTYVLLGSSLRFDKKIARLLDRYQIFYYRFGGISNTKFLWRHQIPHLVELAQKVIVLRPLAAGRARTLLSREPNSTAGHAFRAKKSVETIRFIPAPEPVHNDRLRRWAKQHLYPALEALLNRRHLPFSTHHTLQLAYVDYIIYDPAQPRQALVRCLANPGKHHLATTMDDLRHFAQHYPHESTITLDLAIALPAGSYSEAVVQQVHEAGQIIIDVPCPPAALQLLKSQISRATQPPSKQRSARKDSP